MKIIHLPPAGQTAPADRQPSRSQTPQQPSQHRTDRVTLSFRRGAGHLSLDQDQLSKLWQAQDADDRLLVTRAQVLLHPDQGIKAQANLDPAMATRLLEPN